MGRKRKLTGREKAEKKRRRALYTTMYLNGKRVRIREEPLVGEELANYLRACGGDLALHQAEMWEFIEPPEREAAEIRKGSEGDEDLDDIPF